MKFPAATQKLLPFLMASTLAEITPPKAHEWRVLNDQTERGGASTGLVHDVADGIEFTGSLGSIPGHDGKPVAFSLARFDYKPDLSSSRMRVNLSSLTPLTALIVVAPAPPPQGQPVLTYQKAVRLSGGFDENNYSLAWSEFEPTIRGKKVESAPALDLSKIESWAVQVTRSSQPGQERYEPIDFRIRVLTTRP